MCPVDLKPCCDDICHGAGCLNSEGEDMIELCHECHEPLEDCVCEPDYDDEDIYDEDQPTNHFTDIRGPAQCPRRCSECSDGLHHWLIVTFPGCLDESDDDYKEALNHPAVQEWIAARENYPQSHEDRDGIDWFQCKHCDAWHPVTEAMIDDPDFEFV